MKFLMLMSIKISRNSGGGGGRGGVGSDKPRMLFFLVINVKMPTVICWHFNIYEQEKLNAQLS